jgi:hypothetical protein
MIRHIAILALQAAAIVALSWAVWELVYHIGLAQ